MNHKRPLRFTAVMLLTASALTGGAVGAAPVSSDDAALQAVGESIYLHGLLPDGSSLKGARADGVEIRGTQAACSSCHRRSGLGGVEGDTWVPPVTGKALFGNGREVVVRTSRRFNAAVSVPEPARTDAEVAAMLRDGHRPDGRAMSALMPRYSLSPADEKALLAYLHRLGGRPAPGVTGDTIHFATVLTPDVSPERGDALLRTLGAFVQSRNVSQFAGMRKRIPREERQTQSRRRWKLHTWDLKGPASTWPAQLAEFQRAQPVLALLSGASDDTWAPMAAFCDESRVACWFPSTDSPPEHIAEASLGLYFSAGAFLDGAVVAREVHAAGMTAVAVITDESRQATAALAAMRRALPKQVVIRQLDPQRLGDHDDALVEAKESLVIFGGTALASALTSHRPPSQRIWWASSEGTGLAANLPEAWQRRVTWIDRLEVEPLRGANLQRFRSWANMLSLPISDERLQAEAYFAAGALSATVTEVLNNLQPEYLVERVQDTLSMRETEALQMQIQNLMMGGGGGHRPASSMPAEAADQIERRAANLELQRQRTSTSIYPRLSLGPDQHFASKGAYVIPPDSPARWVVPEGNEPSRIESKPASENSHAAPRSQSTGAMQ